MAEASSTPTTILASSPEVYAPGALRGWSVLQEAVNVILPGLLSQAAAVGQATDQLLGRG